MNLIVYNNKKEVSKNVALLISKEINKNPKLVLCLATGETMIPIYKELVKLYKKKLVDFSHVKTFNLDEYVGLSCNNKNSYRYFMEKNLFSKVNIKKNNINFLNGIAKNLDEECKKYDKKIKRSVIDLAILGLGVNGHIAFNEPGSKFNSKIRVVELSENTRKVNSRFFNSLNEVPKMALSVGVKTILDSKKIILVATGKEKSNVVEKTIKSKINQNIPSSFLKKHKSCLFIIDKEAGVN